ncbi:MAG TPA: hypothetical protein GXX28_01095, partial [Firmicutes bacterium]|nr:hypothetical protein [Bacillota bacterium]
YSDPAEAAEQYVNDPAFDHNNDEANFTSEEKATIATLLARYIEDAFEGACIMVSRSDSGTYDIPGAAEVENWDDVRADADSVERVSDLAGWGIWNAVYRVEVNGGEAWYFVNEG